MVPELRARAARSDDGSAQEEEEEDRERAQEETEGIDGIRPEMNALAGEVAASPRPKRSKPSGEIDASPKPKKTRDAPSPSPKRAKKPSPPAHEKEAEVEEGVEEPAAGPPEEDAPAKQADASPPPKPPGEIVASPSNKKKCAMRGKKSPPPQEDQEEAEEERAAGADEAEVVVESGEASPVRNATADETAASPLPKTSGEVAVSPQHKKRGEMSPVPKRGKKPGSDEEPETAQEVESGKAPAKMDVMAGKTAVSSPPRKKWNKPSADNATSPKHKRADETAVSPGPQHGAMSPGLKRGKKPGSNEEPETAQEDSGKAPAELDVTADKTADASSPQRKKRSKPSGDNPTSPNLKRGKEVRKPLSLPLDESVKLGPNEEEAVEQEKEGTGEDGADKSGIALSERNASWAKLRSSSQEKKPAVERSRSRSSSREKKAAVERSWSMEDELRILTALAEHAQAHGGALLEASDLFTALSSSFDRRDANADKLANKVRKLKGRHDRVRSQGCPTDDHGRRLFELCETVWGSAALQNSSHGASVALRRSLRKTSNSANVVLEEAHQEDGGEHTDAPPTGALSVDVNSVPFMKDGDINSGKCEDNGVQVDEHKQVKKSAVERSWSMEDELRILTALAEHAETHGGALLEASDLFAALSSSFDRRDANADKLASKVRKLRGRHERVRSQGCPTDDHGRRLFELCGIVWGNGTSQNSSHGASVALRRSLRKTSNSSNVVPEEAHQEDGGEHMDAPPTGALSVDVGSLPFVKDGDGSGKCEDNGGQVDQDKQVKVKYVRREFSELSRLYPFLAEEVKRYADTHNSGELIMAAFETIADDEARNLDARCKKQRMDMFNLEMSQADLTKALLCTLAGRMN